MSQKFIKRRKPRAAVSKKKPASNFDPNRFLNRSNETKQVTPAAPAPSWKFEDTKLDDRLKANIARLGFITPTPIQERSLTFLMEGRDLLGIASTGTGKTGAFLIPIINRLLTEKSRISLIVVPTRELALQVEEVFLSLAQGLGLEAACFIGGKSVEQDKKKLRKVNHVLIGTPGRLLDLCGQGLIKLPTVTTLVLDEFDRMLEMGFIREVRTLLNGLTNRKQTIFFSATLDKQQQPLIDEILRNPVEVKISSGITISEKVDQELIRVKEGQNKFDLLMNLLNREEVKKVLIFAETKRGVNVLGKKLNEKGVKAELIHGNKSQNYRVNALNLFNEGKVKVLVATDIAARGLDVPDVTHVINYQVPRNQDSYIHRVGRTGRGGQSGKAYTFVE